MIDTEQQGALSDVEIALIDSIKSIIEMLAAKKIAQPEEFAPIFEFQRNKVLEKQQPTSAAVFEMLRLFCLDPERRQFRDLITKPPAGSA
jgi:hypothetical protein